MNYSKDFFFNTLSNLFSMSFTWLITLLIVRIAGFESAGIFSLAMTTGSIYSPIASFTSRTYILADVNNDFSNSCYLYLRIMTMFLSFILCLIISFFLHYTLYEWSAIVLYYVFLLTESFEDILFGIYQRGGALAQAGILGCGRAIVFFLSFMISIYFSHNLLLSISVMATFSWIYILCVENFAIRKRYPKIWSIQQVSYKELLNLFIICVPLMILIFLSNALRSIPRLFFQKMYSSEQYGIFSSISSLTLIFSTAVICLLMPVVPKFSQFYFNNKKKELSKLTFGSMLIILVLCIISFLLSYIFGKSILIFFFGEKILSHMDTFYWTLLSVVLYAITIVQSDFLVAARKQKELIIGSIISIIICLLTAYPFCKLFYMNGMPYNLIISYLFQIIYFSFIIIKTLLAMKEN